MTGPAAIDLSATNVSPDVARQLLRALDRSPGAVVTLIGSDLKTRWVSTSATWVTGTDPTSRKGRGTLERVHPDDVEPLIHAIGQLLSASAERTPTVPVIEPIRYRVDIDGRWVTMESVVLNMIGDPQVDGLVLIGRPVGADSGTTELDNTGTVVDLLVAGAPLMKVLTACARLVPGYLGSAAVITMVDGEPVIGAAPDGPAARLARDPRWWRATLEDGQARQPTAFLGFPDDLVEPARAEGFSSAWISPVTDTSTGEVLCCLATWVRLKVERNVATDHGLRQAERLSALVVGEQRRHAELRRQVVTDPLTGVKNRSALQHRLDSVDTSPIPAGGPAPYDAAGDVTVAVFDLDDFKPVNDTHGHEVGDVVLQVVAERISADVRTDDLVVRLGGDEFAVVFAAGTTRANAQRSTQRIRDAVRQPITVDGVTVSVGASVGLATGPADEVMRQADRALYAAKADKPDKTTD